MAARKTNAPLALLAALTLAASAAASAAVSAAAGGDAQDKPEVMSLLGRPLYAIPAAGEELAKLEQELADARAARNARPNDPEAVVLLGRRLAALWRYREAIEVYTQGIMRWSDNAMLFRHRGHRFISVREFEKAVLDLVKARTLKENDFDILYHLGLAFYLEGRFEMAGRAYEACLQASADEGSSVAVRHWLFMTLRRLGRSGEADALLEGIHPDMSVGENVPYLNLLLFYKSLKTEADILKLMETSPLDAATLGNGLAVWMLTSGREAEARSLMERIVALDHWPAFGFIAAEAELARRKSAAD
jgi:tetratricopeptide (TPR) repeat protein